MQITTSCKSHICGVGRTNRRFNETLRVYRSAVAFFVGVCDKEWKLISSAKGIKARQSILESLTWPTKNRPSVPYDFSACEEFRCMPCYLRRAACSAAIGIYASYYSNHENWIHSSRNGKEPQLPTHQPMVFPVMYRGNMFNPGRDDYHVCIKLFNGKTWVWQEVRLRKSDVDYALRNSGEVSAPTLKKKHHGWYLEFAYTEEVKLNDLPVSEQVIAAVDLGVANAATVSVMKSDGTLVARKFLSLASENDHFTHTLNRIKKSQQLGSREMPGKWASANGINKDISAKTAKFIVDTAEEYHCTTIVFEHLEFRGKKKGSKKQRLHHWKQAEAQRITETRAHRLGIRISHVNAKNTSHLAFDGSGSVKRGKKSSADMSYSLCRFSSGKVYNCDLNASYNIGARYFIREIIKSLPEKTGLGISAKVPECSNRSRCTLNTLLMLNRELAAMPA